MRQTTPRTRKARGAGGSQRPTRTSVSATRGQVALHSISAHPAGKDQPSRETQSSGVSMTAAIDDWRTALHLDLMRAHGELAEARHRQKQKDSPSNRAALATCLTRMDTVLDRYLASTTLRG